MDQILNYVIICHFNNYVNNDGNPNLFIFSS